MSAVLCEFTMPMRLVAQVQSREHWAVINRRATVQKAATYAIGAAALRRAPPMRPPYRVTIVRIGPRKMDMDNVTGSAKHCRDSIAKLLKVDDGDEARIIFHYGQRTTGKKLPLRPYQVEVVIEGSPA